MRVTACQDCGQALFNDPNVLCTTCVVKRLLPKESAELAAAAPDMARLLLDLEWSGCEQQPYDSCIPACPACGVPKYDDLGDEREVRPKHAEGCRLIAVLRQAGVGR